MWLAEKGGQLYSHPYDIGAYENLSTVSPFFLSCLLLVHSNRYIILKMVSNYKSLSSSLSEIVTFVLLICYRFWVQMFYAGFALLHDILELAFVSELSTINSLGYRIQIKDGFFSQIYTPDNIHTDFYL